jgi:predicted nucleotidyltransferase
MVAGIPNEPKEKAGEGLGTSRFPNLHDPRYPVHRVAERLEPYLRLIVERVRPEKIVLFGSYAYGQPDEHSDFDLLVVRRGIVSEAESDLEIRQLLWEIPGRRPPFTILTTTPDHLAERLRRRSPFYEDILRKGVELYAA